MLPSFVSIRRLIVASLVTGACLVKTRDAGLRRAEWRRYRNRTRCRRLLGPRRP